MKKNLKLIAVIAVLIFSTTIALQAQNRNGQGQGKHQGEGNGTCVHQPKGQGPLGFTSNIPNLTDAQKEKIDKIKLQLQKDILPVRNEIREKEAKLITLQTVDKPDINKINALIDEVADLEAKIRKLHAKARLDIRNLLDDEQRIWFDTHGQKGHYKGGHHNHPKQGPNGQGRPTGQCDGNGPHHGNTGHGPGRGPQNSN
jgi:Spy/CpxP family protein refolding chaperone